MNAGDPCKCGHYLTVVKSLKQSSSRVQYLGCRKCGVRPRENKVVAQLPLDGAERKRLREKTFEIRQSMIALNDEMDALETHGLDVSALRNAWDRMSARWGEVTCILNDDRDTVSRQPQSTSVH